MNSDRLLTINKIRELVDEYHNGAHSMAALLELRRDIAVYMFRLTAHVKSAYGNKTRANILRKYSFYREIVAAMDIDKKALGKTRSMNAYEVQTEAMDGVLQAKKAEAQAEAEWEEVKYTVDIGKQILASMSQELADFRHEKTHTHFLDEAQQRDTLKGLGA